MHEVSIAVSAEEAAEIARINREIKDLQATLTKREAVLYERARAALPQPAKPTDLQVGKATADTGAYLVTVSLVERGTKDWGTIQDDLVGLKATFTNGNGTPKLLSREHLEKMIEKRTKGSVRKDVTVQPTGKLPPA